MIHDKKLDEMPLKKEHKFVAPKRSSRSVSRSRSRSTSNPKRRKTASRLRGKPNHLADDLGALHVFKNKFNLHTYQGNQVEEYASLGHHEDPDPIDYTLGATPEP